MIHRIIHVFNLPKHICNHVLGENHTKAHRMGAGMIVMVIGVTVAKSCANIHFLNLHFIADLIGYGIHGLGLTPFIEHLAEQGKHHEEEREQRAQDEVKNVENESEKEKKELEPVE